MLIEPGPAAASPPDTDHVTGAASPFASRATNRYTGAPRLSVPLHPVQFVSIAAIPGETANDAFTGFAVTVAVPHPASISTTGPAKTALAASATLRTPAPTDNGCTGIRDLRRKVSGSCLRHAPLDGATRASHGHSRPSPRHTNAELQRMGVLSDFTGACVTAVRTPQGRTIQPVEGEAFHTPAVVQAFARIPAATSATRRYDSSRSSCVNVSVTTIASEAPVSRTSFSSPALTVAFEPTIAAPSRLSTAARSHSVHNPSIESTGGSSSTG